MFTSTSLAAVVIFAVTNKQSDRRNLIGKANDANISDQEHRQIEISYWRKQFRATLFALVAAIIGACIAYKAYLAAVQQVTVMSDTEQRQLRAYVFLSSVKFEEQSIKVQIKNEGQTPAFNVTYWWNAASFKLPESPTDQLTYEDTVPGISVDVGPQGDHDLNPIDDLSHKVSPSDITDADQGNRKIYVWGLIKYRDVFVRCQSNQFAYRYFMHQWYLVKGGHSSTDPAGKCTDEKEPRSDYQPPVIRVIDSK